MNRLKVIHSHCRECGAALESYVQPGYAEAGVPDRVYVTCRTSPMLCALGGHTLDDATYDEKDISDYVATWERRLKHLRECRAEEVYG